MSRLSPCLRTVDFLSDRKHTGGPSPTHRPISRSGAWWEEGKGRGQYQWFSWLAGCLLAVLCSEREENICCPLGGREKPGERVRRARRGRRALQSSISRVPPPPPDQGEGAGCRPLAADPRNHSALHPCCHSDVQMLPDRHLICSHDDGVCTWVCIWVCTWVWRRGRGVSVVLSKTMFILILIFSVACK